MADWATLEHAYGSARDVPDLLAAAEHASEETGPEWDDLWSRLCHQGTVYTASYAAIPALDAMATRHAPAGYVAALQLAASIIASQDGPRPGADVRRDHPEHVANLRALAESSLALADDDTEFVYGLQALMAFEDGGVWQRCLDHLADGEMPMTCPACHATLVLDLSSEASTLADLHDGSVPPTYVEPGRAAPGTVEERLLALATAHGRDVVATQVQRLLGEADCPRCGHHFTVTDALY
ncbi:hypothetical protein GCM10009721_14710 [Terrabacter tumescens]|uniref:Uncharacterized protein n=1 Tax=Terrabacter tumescens TaxID=60443 RepID=A0ABQ2HSH5_9MICO|nr:hypothetical protein [Terrabacter tumescens]GGM90322.1 hypothetical protein GCM10009721_14710 [Terrabacter tumescens]